MKSVYLIWLIALIQMSCQSDSGHSGSSLGTEVIIDYDTALWAEVLPIEDKLIVDLKYATDQTPIGKAVYDCPRCFLTKEASIGFHKMLNKINEDGYMVKIWDCYRPTSTQSRILDNATDDRYQMNTMRGPMHVRGLAVDFTLCDLQGHELDMGSEFDDLSKRASHIYMDLPKEILDRRRYLLNITREFGFQAIRNEWWHYNYRHSTAVMMDYKWSCN
jgi:D-alanyl-D-alanine dipeptidase